MFYRGVLIRFGRLFMFDEMCLYPADVFILKVNMFSFFNSTHVNDIPRRI